MLTLSSTSTTKVKKKLSGIDRSILKIGAKTHLKELLDAKN
jgi:hypothetical protein